MDLEGDIPHSCLIASLGFLLVCLFVYVFVYGFLLWDSVIVGQMIFLNSIKMKTAFRRRRRWKKKKQEEEEKEEGGKGGGRGGGGSSSSRVFKTNFLRTPKIYHLSRGKEKIETY